MTFWIKTSCNFSAHGWSEEEVNECFQQLVQSGEIKAVEHGAYTRHHETDTHIQVTSNVYLLLHDISHYV